MASFATKRPNCYENRQPTSNSIDSTWGNTDRLPRSMPRGASTTPRQFSQPPDGARQLKKWEICPSGSRFNTPKTNLGGDGGDKRILQRLFPLRTGPHYELPGQDSNLEWRNQNPQCYHYTTGQFLIWPILYRAVPRFRKVPRCPPGPQ